MLRVDLVRLDREGVLRVEGAIHPDDPLFEGSGIRFTSPLQARVTVTLAGSGEVVVRGNVQGSLVQECRRCLVELRSPFDADLTLVFATAGESGENLEGNVYPLEATAVELDLRRPVREELLLLLPSYADCRADCRGLCSGCGTNLNEEECRCSGEELDPRWDVLRALDST